MIDHTLFIFVSLFDHIADVLSYDDFDIKPMISSMLAGVYLHVRRCEDKEFKEKIVKLDPSFTKLTWMSKNKEQVLLIADVVSRYNVVIILF